jgi:hypothetical protein
MVADVVLSISRRAHEKSTGWGRLFVAKNRAGRDGLVYPVKIDTARSKFSITGDAGTLNDAEKENENDFKRIIRQRWKELRNDDVLGPKIVKKDSDDGNSDEGQN